MSMICFCQEELKAARAPNPSADGKDSLMKTYSNRFNLARKSAGLALKNTFITTPTVTLERRSPSAVTMPITPSTLESRPSATPGSANPQQEEGV